MAAALPHPICGRIKYAADEKRPIALLSASGGLGRKNPEVATAISIEHLVAEIPSSTIGNEPPLANVLLASIARILKEADLKSFSAGTPLGKPLRAYFRDHQGRWRILGHTAECAG